jgi:Mycothiol maleylpyruvate isomerase N-terminal domain
VDVAHATGQQAFVDALAAFMAAAEAMGDVGLMDRSRCRGWSRADLMVHVHFGLQELFVGIHAPTDAAADTDAASYWKRDLPTNDTEADDLDALRFVQRVSLAYRRPNGVVGHLKATATAADHAARSVTPGALAFQGHVMTTGNFLAMWAVELCIHHLDLSCGDEVTGPTAQALTLTRGTVEALVGAAFPSGWSDEKVALLGAGRLQPGPQERAELERLADLLPVLG